MEKKKKLIFIIVLCSFILSLATLVLPFIASQSGEFEITYLDFIKAVIKNLGTENIDWTKDITALLYVGAILTSLGTMINIVLYNNKNTKAKFIKKFKKNNIILTIAMNSILIAVAIILQICVVSETPLLKFGSGFLAFLFASIFSIVGVSLFQISMKEELTKDTLEKSDNSNNKDSNMINVDKIKNVNLNEIKEQEKDNLN